MYGNIARVACVLLSNCRGRLYDLGARAGRDEVAPIRRLYDVPISGFYGDGETCSTKRGFHLHTTWTVATLVLGDDFNTRFAIALERQLMARLAAAPMPSEPDVLGDMVSFAKRLLGTDYCHIRFLEGDKLVKKYGEGGWYSCLPHSIDITRYAGNSAQKAFTTGEYVLRTSGEVRREIEADPTILEGWLPDLDPDDKQGLVFKYLDKLAWFLTVPIIAGGQSVGVLSFASDSPDFGAADGNAAPRCVTPAEQLAEMMAIPLMSLQRRQQLQEVLA